MSECPPPPYLPGTYLGRVQQAVAALEQRAADLSQQLDQVLHGENLAAGMSADTIAVQLVQVEAAARLLRERAARA